MNEAAARAELHLRAAALGRGDARHVDVFDLIRAPRAAARGTSREIQSTECRASRGAELCVDSSRIRRQRLAQSANKFAGFIVRDEQEEAALLFLGKRDQDVLDSPRRPGLNQRRLERDVEDLLSRKLERSAAFKGKISREVLGVEQ